MKKFLLKWLKPFIKKLIVKKLSDKKFKQKVVSEINKRVDIPKVNEAEEKKFINALYAAVEQIALDIIEDI